MKAVQFDEVKYMENAKEPERAEAERVEAEVVYSPIVAEPTEYQYGAEAFEAVYPKMDAEIKPDMKAPSVPKTGKAR